MRCCVDNCFLLTIFFSIEKTLPKCKAPWSWLISNLVVPTCSQEVQIQYCFIIMVKDGQSFLSFPLCLSPSPMPGRTSHWFCPLQQLSNCLKAGSGFVILETSLVWGTYSEWLLYSGLYCIGLWHSSAPLLLQIILLRDPQVCCPSEFCYRSQVQRQEPTYYVRVLSLWSNTP